MTSQEEVCLAYGMVPNYPALAGRRKTANTGNRRLLDPL